MDESLDTKREIAIDICAVASGRIAGLTLLKKIIIVATDPTIKEGSGELATLVTSLGYEGNEAIIAKLKRVIEQLEK